MDNAEMVIFIVMRRTNLSKKYALYLEIYEYSFLDDEV